jgi:F-type H+-transporting ATPase subunit alpha
MHVCWTICWRKQVQAMATEFSREFFADNRIVKAELRSARKPREEELNRIRAEVRKLYDATEVILNVTVDESLLSGYVLQVGDRVFDNSGRHQLDKMMEGKPSLATLKTRIEDYKPAETSAEGGVVISSADGIVHVEGMNRAVYGEIVTFDNGAKGMVESVDPEQLGIMLFDGAETVGVGTMVTRSGKRAGIPVGDAFLGRVISPLGEPIDGKGPIEAVGYNPIEKQAPGILERQSVDTPLHTGILAIDSMFPIGRGQRELIIGDRQTGKTSIATDAILNQKNTGVLCIYVAIGQKASSIARVAGDLQKHGAMSYTTIVAATASDSAPLQYIAPYAGTALAEYFMSQGKSVLIVYDDLSKHAVAYRAISLLLRRSPGREAYPGDVFYLHSRLLERSCRMRDDLGGGSITALPIVETQAGDVSAYIPTNVISITDGQIFLESALFNAGNRPAVNVGLSVSRVGGAAQTKAMKKANANLRIELAQYKDMESFAQFSSDLDAETRRQLDHGKALMEMLKQPLYQPKSDAEQVVTLVLASHGVLDELPTAELRAKTSAFVRQFRADVSGTMDKITATGKLEPEMVDAILNAWKAYAGGDSHAVQ